MKLYKNISRFRWRRMFSKGSQSEKKLLWGASLKPGDLVAACTGFNVRIVAIQPEKTWAKDWFSSTLFGAYKFKGRPQGWFIHDFQITDEQGMWHYIDSCCWEKETVEQIEAFWKSIPPRPNDEKLCRIQALLAEGKRICDDDGVILPELVSGNYNLGRKDVE